MPELGGEIALRPMRVEDLNAVLEIEASSFSKPWTEDHFLDELNSCFSHPMVALAPGGAVAGYLCLKQVLDEAEILDVAVEPSQRGRGIGRILVDWALSFCRERGVKTTFLEVRAGNVEAIALYRRMGFNEAGVRKKYYDNGDDAIVMEYNVEQNIDVEHRT